MPTHFFRLVRASNRLPIMTNRAASLSNRLTGESNRLAVTQNRLPTKSRELPTVEIRAVDCDNSNYYRRDFRANRSAMR